MRHLGLGKPGVAGSNPVGPIATPVKDEKSFRASESMLSEISKSCIKRTSSAGGKSKATIVVKW